MNPTCTPWDHSAVIAVPELGELLAAREHLLSSLACEEAEAAVTPTALVLDENGGLHALTCDTPALEEVVESPLAALTLLVSTDAACSCWLQSWVWLQSFLEEQRAATWALVAFERLRMRLNSQLVHVSLDRRDPAAWEIVLDALELLRELASIASTTTPQLWEQVDVIRRHLRGFVRTLGDEALHTLVVALDAAGLPEPLGDAPPAARLAAVGEGELLEGWNAELTDPVLVICELDGRATDGLTLAWAVASHRTQRGGRTLLTLPEGLVSYLEGQPCMRSAPTSVTTREAEVLFSLAGGQRLTDLDLAHLAQMARNVLATV